MSLTLGLIVGATVVDGLLAGLNVDRVFVQNPAWRKVGTGAWAAYSRHADLGAGLVLYPLEAVGGALLTVAGAVAFHFDGSAARSASLPIHLAVVLVIGGLLSTVAAAPKMLSLRRIGDDPRAIESAFVGFKRWGNVRAVFQVLAFGANLWALVAVLRPGG